jgi:molecular chaperone DnaK
MSKKVRKIAVGIDLGTTTSCLAYYDRNSDAAKVVEIDPDNGNNVMPSVVAYVQDGDSMRTLVGKVAQNQLVINPENTLFETKRFIGRARSDFTGTDDAKWLASIPYKTESTKNDEVQIIVPGIKKPIKPEEVGARILQAAVSAAKEKLKSADTEIVIEDAVITVPAYFNDNQRQATKLAGHIAGLNVLRVLSEPTAAAMAYGMQERKEGMVLVYDMGGGTFDVSIIDLQDGVLEVKTTNGDTHLGGADFDQRIIDWIAGRIKAQLGIDVQADLTLKQRVRDVAERAKKALSSSVSTEISLPFIGNDSSGPKHFSCTLGRTELEHITHDLIERAGKCCEAALKDAGLTRAQISEVVLVGGMTRMPKIAQWVKDFFGREPCKKVNPDEVVAIGASMMASTLTKSEGDKDSKVDEMMTLDVTPLSLGIETLGGIFTPVVQKDTTIPTTKSQTFSTAEDNQPQVEIKIYQGERKLAADNKLLGTFSLAGINPAPRGVPQIEVKFDIDSNGILKVTAQDKASGKSQELEVKSSSKPPQEEIDRMVNDAAKYAAEDERRREVAEQKNIVTGKLYDINRALKDVEDVIDKEEGVKVHADMEAVRAALVGDDLEKIKSSIETLEKHMPKLRELKSSKPQKAGKDEDAQSDASADAGSDTSSGASDSEPEA